MRRPLPWIRAVAQSLALCAIVVGGLTSGARAEITSTPLANGAVVLCEDRPDAPVDVCVVAFDAWPLPWRYGPAEMHVLAAVLDALVRRAADTSSAAGSDLSCAMDGDVLVLMGVGPRGSLSEVVRAISSVLTDKLDPIVVSDVLASLRHTTDDERSPGELATAVAGAAALAPVPLVAGPADLQAVASRCAPEAVGALRSTRLVGARCAASIVCGGGSAEAVARLRDALTRLPAGGPNPEAGRLYPTGPTAPMRPSYIGTLSWVVVAYVVPGPENADASCLLALQQLLGGGNEGLLFRRLRGEMDLTYAVATSLTWYRSVGLMTLTCACDPAQAERVAGEMCSVVEELRGGVREEDGDRATARARFELLMASHRSSRVAADRGSWVVRGLRADLCDVWANELGTIDADRIASAVSQWLAKPVVVIGNPAPLSNRLTDGK